MYQCNITGNFFNLEDSEKMREFHQRFGCVSRFRAVSYVLTKILFNEVKILSEIEKNKKIKCIGMSDSGYDKILEDKFDYINTYYHTEPYLDIYNNKHCDKYNELDFIISTDVFEHIDPFPGVQNAFNNLFKMLKKGGFIVFSVPYDENGEHLEHYPNLFKYKIVKKGEDYILYNTTVDGVKEEFNNLCFHGGPGNVLEMRLFSKKSIISFLEKSGFADITFHNITEDMNKYGIFWSPTNNNNSSLIISAKKV
jgi:SAM-dependent methyltransferase